MINEILLTSAVLIASLGNISQSTINAPSASLVVQTQVLAVHELDLTNRLPDEAGSQVFADNILLTLHYLKGDALDEKYQKQEKYQKYQREFDWEKLREPFTTSLTLEPGEIFAYHDTVLSEFKNEKIKTTNAHFIASEGFKPLSGLYGNGVCHLASLINWVAQDAGLEVVAHVNHDFYLVPGVPRKYGTSIRWGPSGEFNSRNQNLYVTNNFDFPVEFVFKADRESISLSILSL